MDEIVLFCGELYSIGKFFVRILGFIRTSSRADSIHGGHGLPLILLWVVAFTGAKPAGPVKPPHSIKQPVNDCHTHADAPC